MTDGLPIYFSCDLYHRSKVGLKGVFDAFGLEWNADEKAWISACCRVVGVFAGHKKPALLYVSGSDSFIEQIKEFVISIGAEIREAEVKDIRTIRKEESEAKKIAEEKEKAIRERCSGFWKGFDEKKAFDDVVIYKVERMRCTGLSDEFIRKWLKLELGVDLDNDGKPRLAIGLDSLPKEVVCQFADDKNRAECKTKDLFKDDSRVREVGSKLSFLCESNSHKDCGGYMCSCSCHNGAE